MSRNDDHLRSDGRQTHTHTHIVQFPVGWAEWKSSEQQRCTLLCKSQVTFHCHNSPLTLSLLLTPTCLNIHPHHLHMTLNVKICQRNISQTVDRIMYLLRQLVTPWMWWHNMGMVEMKDTVDNGMMGHSCGQSGGIKNSGWSHPHYFFGEVAIHQLEFTMQFVNMNMCLIWRGTYIGHIIAQHVQVPHCLSQALKGQWQTNNYQRHKGPRENNSL